MKAMKGTMFFLPLPLQNMLDRLDEAGFRAQFSADDIMSTLPDPELYIIVDGQPTKDKVVWQSIVDVDNVRHAVDKLRETNWLENPISVSRKFSQKFHDFFDTVLIKRAVLGEVTHAFWKKE